MDEKERKEINKEIDEQINKKLKDEIQVDIWTMNHKQRMGTIWWMVLMIILGIIAFIVASQIS